MKALKTLLLIFVYGFWSNSTFSQNCTELGTYLGTFSASSLTYLDAETPQIVRTILKDNNISFIANDNNALSNFENFLDSLDSRNIEVVLSVRFPRKDTLDKEDRIVFDQTELNAFMSDLQTLLSISNDKIDYLQVLNEPFGVGRYTTTIDSLTNISSQQIAEQTVLTWMDTITSRFRTLIDNQFYEIKLLTPSVQVKGLRSVQNNNTNAWTYKVTKKIFELANNYCDIVNFHWYPDSIQEMQNLMAVVDTSSVLQLNPNIKISCTEWSQAHEIRNIILADTTFWETQLSLHCGTNDPSLENDYLTLINSTLGIDHSHTYEMYQLMNNSSYEFATYFAMLQDYYTCGSDRMYNYALASLYATKFTVNKVQNGLFYTQYQNIKQYILDNCSVNSVNFPHNNFKKITVYPNPFTKYATVEFENFNNEKFTLKLYNILGENVQTISNISTDKIIIRRDNLKSGVYFFQLRLGKQISIIDKLIIE